MLSLNRFQSLVKVKVNLNRNEMRGEREVENDEKASTGAFNNQSSRESVREAIGKYSLSICDSSVLRNFPFSFFSMSLN
uniref:Uncharacterized protein n=1 Tax=Caenorhabditis japonica TaxID=281687 RepID=A0A8R1IQL3_CAEJA